MAAWAGAVWGRRDWPWSLMVGRQVRGWGWEPCCHYQGHLLTPGDLRHLLSPLSLPWAALLCPGVSDSFRQGKEPRSYTLILALTLTCVTLGKSLPLSLYVCFLLCDMRDQETNPCFPSSSAMQPDRCASGLLG